MISDNKSIDNNSSTSKRIITRYKQYLTLEKALSPNTVDAYLQDLSKLMHYLKIEQVNILDTTLDHLEQFVSGLHDVGIHPRSQARIISGIHSFFRFLFIEDMKYEHQADHQLWHYQTHRLHKARQYSHNLTNTEIWNSLSLYNE